MTVEMMPVNSNADASPTVRQECKRPAGYSSAGRLGLTLVINPPAMAETVVRVAALADLHCTKTLAGRLPTAVRAHCRVGRPAAAGRRPDRLRSAGGSARAGEGTRRRCRIPVAAVLGNHDVESGKADEVTRDSRRGRTHRAGRRCVRAARHRHRRRQGLRRRIRQARARSVGRDDHQAVRPRGGRRGAEARGGARAPAHAAARRAAALLTGPADRGGRAARDLSVPRIEPPRGAARTVSGVARVPRPRAPRASSKG